VMVTTMLSFTIKIWTKNSNTNNLVSVSSTVTGRSHQIYFNLKVARLGFTPRELTRQSNRCLNLIKDLKIIGCMNSLIRTSLPLQFRV
jgi:hypothetical protein